MDQFLGSTSAYGCPLPCTQKSYNFNLEYFSKYSFLGAEEPVNLDNENFKFVMFFRSVDTEESTETLVYDFTNFLTAAGGNLGLFMGFSCFSLVHWFFVLINKIFSYINWIKIIVLILWKDYQSSFLQSMTCLNMTAQ